jgi:hypothetical protein
MGSPRERADDAERVVGPVLAGAVRVGDAQRAGEETVDAGVEQVVALTESLVHAVQADRGDRLVLGHRDVEHPAVLQSRPGEHRAGLGCVPTERLQHGQLGAAVRSQVEQRCRHGAGGTRPAREREDRVPADDQLVEDGLVTGAALDELEVTEAVAQACGHMG